MVSKLTLIRLPVKPKKKPLEPIVFFGVGMADLRPGRSVVFGRDSAGRGIAEIGGFLDKARFQKTVFKILTFGIF